MNCLIFHKYQYSLYYFRSFFEEVGYSYYHRTDQFHIWKWNELGEKLVRYRQSISSRDFPEILFIEMNFSEVTHNLKIPFFIVFNLVSKLVSTTAANRFSWSGFILTVHNGEEIAVAVIVEKEVRVKRVLQLAVVIGTVAWLIIGGKVSSISSLII